MNTNVFDEVFSVMNKEYVRWSEHSIGYGFQHIVPDRDKGVELVIRISKESQHNGGHEDPCVRLTSQSMVTRKPGPDPVWDFLSASVDIFPLSTMDSDRDKRKKFVDWVARTRQNYDKTVGVISS